MFFIFLTYYFVSSPLSASAFAISSSSPFFGSPETSLTHSSPRSISPLYNGNGSPRFESTFLITPTAPDSSSPSVLSSNSQPFSSTSLLTTSPLLSSSIFPRNPTVLSASSPTSPSTAVKVHEIFMPALSSTMKEGKIVQWSKRVGERVEVGDTVMVVESDKADMDVESFSEGYMASQIVPAGNTALVGATVGLLAENPEDIQAVEQQGLNAEIPPGDSSRHDGTTAWNVSEHHAATAPTTPTFPSPPAEFMSEADRADVQAHEIFMPALSSTMTEGRIAKWLKNEGERVNEGDVVMIVESDKADMDVESFVDGYLARIVVPEGSSAAVGATVALIANTPDEIQTVRAAGVQGIVSGSDKRHDMTTVVYNKAPPASAMPESVDVFMPTLSSTMTEGKITKWNKHVGDTVKEGESLMVVESDKADMDVESFEEGYVGAILVDEGKTAKVGEAVAKIVQTPEHVQQMQQALATGGSDSRGAALQTGNAPPRQISSATSSPLPSSISYSPQPEGKLPVFVPESLDQEVSGQLPTGMTHEQLGSEFMRRATSTEEGRRFVEELGKTQKGQEELARMRQRAQYRQPPSGNLFHADMAGRQSSIWRISGYSRELAQKLNIDLSTVVGSGPGGRIFAEDVEKAASGVKAHWGRDAYAQQQQAQKSLPSTTSGSSGTAWQPSQGVVAATPTARQLAAQHQVDIQKIIGSGNFGRVTADDIRKHFGIPPVNVPVAKPSPAEPTQQRGPATDAVAHMPCGAVPLDGMQKAIAANMAATLDVPVFRVSYSIRTDAFDKLYSEIKSKGVTVSAMLSKAVGLALQRHPLINARFDAKASAVVHPGHINVAMAVATEGGLITPVLKDSNSTDLYTLSKTWKGLIAKAKSKTLSRDEYSSGTFVISNLGMFGVSTFEAILPANVGSILAVGASTPIVQLQENGLIGVTKRMTATITCDHRHIYGAHAAEFMKELADIMENRTTELLK
eukprot:GHVS01061279.1.p1 GENE.GHVS01061279.1~~GHVS01061279.1.p1  ORF type:complete len:995 (-),score=195.82 GHVS01061279.1:61-2976(-)